MDRLRRDFIQRVLGTAGISLFPGKLYLDLETLERLSKALRSSSDLDETTLTHLETAVRNSRSEFVLLNGRTWYELFQEMSGNLRIITQLLEQHSSQYRLYTLAGETVLLLGDLLFNAGDNVAADKYYQVALEACSEDALLQAVILGRRALIPIYDRCPEKALPLLSEAQQVAPVAASDLILSWLWSVMAEAYANLGESATCFQALDSAERLLERGRLGETVFSFQPEVAHAIFSPAKFSGYKGVCYLRLKQTEAAQDSLQRQLADAEEQGQIHHKSIALVDLATSCVQKASIRQAYAYAADALACIEYTQSIRVLQRVFELRQAMNPWKNTTYVQSLDEQMHLLVANLTERGK